MTTDNGTYLDDLVAAHHEIVRVEPNGREFDAVCACGSRWHSKRSASDAWSRGDYHVQRMKWRKADAEWLGVIRRDVHPTWRGRGTRDE
jgi:hypothetical protein